MKIRLLLLIGSCAMQAMDLVPLLENKKNKQPLQIKTIQDIPKKSFENIELCFLGLSANKRFNLWKEKNKKSTCLADSLIFNVALLPHDVRLKIVTLMFYGDEKSAQLFYKTPLLYAYRRYQDAKSIILNSSMSRDSLDKKMAEFFRLPAQKQDKIIPIINPSLIERIDYGGSSISYETFTSIKKDAVMNEFLKNYEIRWVSIQEEKNPVCHFMKKLFVSTAMSLCLLALPVIFIDGLLCELNKECSNPLIASFYYHSYSIFVGTVCCAFIAPILLTRHCCTLKRKI